MRLVRDLTKAGRFWCAVSAVVLVSGALVIGLPGLASGKVKRSVPDLTGSWINPAQGNRQVFTLVSSGNRKQLTVSWHGVFPHATEVSKFRGKLNRAKTAYVGTVHNVEGTVRSSGKMTVKIDSASRLSVVNHQNNGHTYKWTLVPKKNSPPPPPACSSTAALAMQADGKSSETVQTGTTVTLNVTMTGSVPSCATPASIKIAGTQSGSSPVSYSCAQAPCQQQVSQSGAGTWSYVATLYDKSGKQLAQSATVTVTWTTPSSPSIMVSSSGAGPVSPPYNPGPGSSTSYYGGAQNGTTICGGAATGPHSNDCVLNQSVNVQSNGATITANVSQPLPSGQQLVIVYDSGNGNDPEFMKCLPGYSVALGCVVAATNGQSTQVTIPIPTSKSDYGGLHYLSMIAEAYPATQPATQLDLALCENGSCG